MFSTLLDNLSRLLSNLKLSSANSFNLKKCKIWERVNTFYKPLLHRLVFFNSLPNIKILDQSNLRAFADNNINGGVRGREVECPTRNHKVSSLIPGTEVNFGIFVCPHLRREYWCISPEAQSREIRISCRTLFLHEYKINTMYF